MCRKERRRPPRCSLVLAALVSLPAAASGQPVGEEFQVNTTTADHQLQAAVATDASGNFVVAWESRNQYPDDFQGVFAQRFDAAGAPQGGEFHVNTTTIDSQGRPSTAMDNDGDFVVVWTSVGQDYPFSGGIFGQLYDEIGAPQGGEFQVNSSAYAYYSQSSPSAAMNAAGDFVVVWRSTGQAYDFDQGGIFGQRFDAAGVPQNFIEFQINTHTTGEQRNPKAAMNDAGDFIVVWESDAQDGDLSGIYAQRFDATGAAQGMEFRVNTTTMGHQTQPAVDIDNSGNFVVVWRAADIFGQRFNAIGAPVGGEFVVNATTVTSQTDPAVGIAADGSFAVAWSSGNGQDGDGDGVFAQRYDADGVTVGGEFQVNEYTTNDQDRVRAAVAPNGNLVVVWESEDQDGPGQGVFGRVVGPAGAADLLEDAIDYLVGLDPQDFTKPGHQKVLAKKLEALQTYDFDDLSDICAAIDKLEHDVLPKTDGLSPPPDWLVGDAQQELEDQVVAIIAALEGDALDLGGCS